MRNLLNPKWLFIINTLPLSILLLIFIGEYQIIHSILNEESKSLWRLFSLFLSILAALNLGYTILLIRKNKNVQLSYSVIVMLIYIPFLYAYSMCSDEILPFTIPQWMVSDNILLYVGTFLMPTLIYSLFILVIHLTSNEKEQYAWKNFLIAFSIPVSWYILSQIILPFWQPLDSNFSIHAVIILIIIITLTFLFFLIRGVFIIGLKKSTILYKHQLIWKIPISILFPLLGLALNNGHFVTGLGFNSIFGDFSHFWFYVLTILNGIFICLPNLDNKKYRLWLFSARSLTFTYTLYFFLVFLPFLPLSVIAIIAVGIGFLMLTPLALFIIHINELVNDLKFLRERYSSRRLLIVPILGISVIPLLITMTYLNDRYILNETLDYLYTPNYSKEYSIDKSSLSKTINIIKEHKKKNRNSLFDKSTPYLSLYFNWIVLDNLTLSNAKIDTIEKVFFAKQKVSRIFESSQEKHVKISKIESNSRFDDKLNSWVSWVDLELTNKSTSNIFSEYSTTMDLPAGCWISDYYLYIGDKKEMGILSEKKSAMFVYSQIRNERKDPGILYYLTGNKVAFKVYPFSTKQTRKTGIEFIHSQPVKLEIDNHTVILGEPTKQNSMRQDNNNDNILYVSPNDKLKLNKIYRAPYYHFIIDTSNGKEKQKEKYVKRIKTLLKKGLISTTNTRISFVNTYTSTYKMDEGWEDIYSKQKFEGGFYLDRAIKKTLFDSYKNNEDKYPVIIVITDEINNSILNNNFANFEITYPENNFFYNLDSGAKLIPHSLLKRSLYPVSKIQHLNFKRSVLPYPNQTNPIAYLPDTHKPSLVLLKDKFDIKDNDITEKNWGSALLLQGKTISYTLHPEISNSEWVDFVRNSFISRILTPVTSYIVVENEAQKVFLRKKQQQVLSGNKSLDLNDDVERMTEPSLILVAILLGTILWLRIYFQRRQLFKKNLGLKVF